MITGINHINITVKNPELMLSFYHELLGFIVILDIIREGEELAKGVGVPGARLRNIRLAVPGSDVQIEFIHYMNVTGKPLNPHPIQDYHIGHICFETDDIAALFTWLTNASVRVVSPPVTIHPGGIQFMYIYDPEGNIIEIAQHRK